MKATDLYRSMFGQMAILTCLFVLGGIALYAQREISMRNRESARDPVEATVARAGRILDRFAAGSGSPSPEQDPVFQAIVQRNPAMNWYVIAKDQRTGSGPQPHFYSALGLDRLSRELDAQPQACADQRRPIVTPQGQGALHYRHCGTLQYSEVEGISRPLPAALLHEAPPANATMWVRSRALLLIAGANFLLFIAVLGWNLARIRRVARQVEGHALTAIDAPLPETGLPAEVLPLVRAVNALVAGRQAADTRRKFFLSAAAHEMRTPLTALRTRLELLDETPLKSELIHDVQRMTDLVNQLLTLVRIQAAATRDPEPVDLVAVCEGVFASLRTPAARREVQLVLEAAQAPVTVSGNRQLVGSAIANLVDNAISFSPCGARVIVTVTADRTVVVRDFGPGLPQGHAAALFEPFVSHPASRNGFGLGLAIVKSVMDTHGGTASAANADPSGGANGAYFLLAFPRPNLP